jgi:hypothetical protein
VIDLAVEIDILVEPSFNQGELIANIINTTDDFFTPKNKEMGQDVYVGELTKEISLQDGVVNLIDVRLYNKVGGQYSSNEVSQRYLDNTTKQIELIDGIIFSQPNQSFQIKYPNKDIVVRTKTTTQTTIS